MKKAHQAARAQGEGHGGSAREEEVPRAEINPMWEGGSSGLRGAEHRQLGTSHRELRDFLFLMLLRRPLRHRDPDPGLGSGRRADLAECAIR